jgi:hypothetical protein
VAIEQWLANYAARATAPAFGGDVDEVLHPQHHLKAA